MTWSHGGDDLSAEVWGPKPEKSILNWRRKEGFLSRDGSRIRGENPRGNARERGMKFDVSEIRETDFVRETCERRDNESIGTKRRRKSARKFRAFYMPVVSARDSNTTVTAAVSERR